MVTSLLCGLGPHDLGCCSVLAPRPGRGPARPASSSPAPSCATCTWAQRPRASSPCSCSSLRLAPIIAPLLGGQLLHVTDWRGVFVVLAGIGAAAALRRVVDAAPTRCAPRAAPHRRPPGPRSRVFGGLLPPADRSWATRWRWGWSFGAMAAYISGSPFVLRGHPRRLAATLQRDLRAERLRASWRPARSAARLWDGSGRVRLLVIGRALRLCGRRSRRPCLRSSSTSGLAGALPELLRAGGVPSASCCPNSVGAGHGRPPAHGRERVGRCSA